jgi:hypothetical protein
LPHRPCAAASNKQTGDIVWRSSILLQTGYTRRRKIKSDLFLNSAEISISIQIAIFADSHIQNKTSGSFLPV